MLKSIEGNFDNPEVNKLLTKHFIELRAASPEGSAHVLDIPGLKVSSIKFWSLWENDKLIGVTTCDEDAQILLASNNGKAIRFSISQIRVEEVAKAIVRRRL